MRWIETDTLSNQNISSAAAIGAYTSDGDRLIICDAMIDQVAGSGDYVMYITKQIAGAGSAYVVLPKTTMTAAAGEVAISAQSGPICVRNGDVLTAYVDGLAGDTTTPDTTVRWFDMAPLQPTVISRTLDVTATGEAGLDWSNIGAPTTTVALSGTTVGTATALGTGAITAAAIATGAIDADALAADAIAEILTTQMTESYAADGAAPTLAQALFAIQQFLQERTVVSTTLTVKKLDGSTAAMTFTLDDASSPTAITRAT